MTPITLLFWLLAASVVLGLALAVAAAATTLAGFPLLAGGLGLAWKVSCRDEDRPPGRGFVAGPIVLGCVPGTLGPTPLAAVLTLGWGFVSFLPDDTGQERATERAREPTAAEGAADTERVSRVLDRARSVPPAEAEPDGG